MQFWLEYGAQQLELRPGVTLIGRSSACELVLNDGLVSRQHARIATSETEAILEDLGSVNGVFVNEERLKGMRLLQAGDRLVVGAQAMTIRLQPSSADKVYSSRATGAKEHAQPPDDSETSRANLLGILGSLAEKNLTLGRGIEAERILQAHLEALLSAAKTGVFQLASIELGAAYAVKLAVATGKASWLDFVLVLYKECVKPLPRPIADDLYAATHKVTGVSLSALRDYLAVLSPLQAELTPSERFVVQRLEGLEGLLAAKSQLG